MGGLGDNLEQINWDQELEKLPKFEKNFYIEHPKVKEMNSSQVDALRKEMDLQVYIILFYYKPGLGHCFRTRSKLFFFFY